MKHKLIALLLAMAMLLSLAPASAGAAAVPSVSAGDISVNQGSYKTLSVTAADFSAVGALDIALYYDSNALSVRSYSVGSMLSGAVSNVNTDTPGVILLTAAIPTGISGSGTLLSISFMSAADAAPASYPIKVAIGECYNTALEPLTVTGTSGSVTVNAAQVAQRTFNLYAYPSPSTAQQGSIVTLPVYNNSSYQLASGDFLVEYDSRLFNVESVEIHRNLQMDGAVYAVNTATAGQVRISYATNQATTSYYLFTVKLRVIADTDTVTSIQYSCSDVHAADLSAYKPYSSSRSVTLTKLPEVIDYPDLYLQRDAWSIGQANSVTVMLEKGTPLAAGDFTVTYDPTVFSCTAAGKSEKTPDGVMIITNPNFGNGTVKFSYVNTGDAFDTDIPLVEITLTPLRSPSEHYEMTLSGNGVVKLEGTQQVPLTLEYVADSDCITGITVVPPGCVTDGYTHHGCGCGKGYQTDPTPMLGHDIKSYPAVAPTCTEEGSAAYEACTRCDLTTWTAIAALGHDTVVHSAQAPSCTEIGWQAYETCTRCDHNTKQELPALGHRIVERSMATVDPILLVNAGTVPFTVQNGVYYSNNHDHSSKSEFTLTALYDCTLQLTYGVSSETNYDKLYLLQNNTQLTVISGEQTNLTMTLQLTPGDIVTVRYQKDVSVHRGSDMGWVKPQWEWVDIIADVEFPAEDFEPDCTNAVICDICSTTVKPALGHSSSYTDNGDGTHDSVCGSCGILEIDNEAHTYVDGFCICRAEEPVVRKEIYGVNRYKNLSLDGVIYIYGYVGFTNADQTENALEKDYVLKNGKVLYWSTQDMPENAEDAILGTQTHISSLTFDSTYEGIHEYQSVSQGIAAKRYGDTIYYRTYIEVDGESYYGEIIEYSVLTYAQNKLNNTKTAAKLKTLLAAMLNYGAAAQTYLKYDTGNLVNACLQTYVDSGKLDAQHLSLSWDDALITAPTAPDAAMTVNFQQTGTSTRTARNLALEGAVEVQWTAVYALNGGKGVKLPDGATATFYFWSGRDYRSIKAAGGVLTTQNATYSTSVVEESKSSKYGYEYVANSHGIAAKQLDETVYVTMVVTETDGTVTCSGVEAYGPHAYAANKLTGTNSNLEVLLKWMIVYGKAATAYLVN